MHSRARKIIIVTPKSNVKTIKVPLPTNKAQKRIHTLLRRFDSYSALSDMLGVNKVTIYRWVYGKTTPSKMAHNLINTVFIS